MTDLAQLGGDELKQILDEKRRSRWQIVFGALLTDTAAENAAVPRKEMPTLIKLKAYQTKLIRQYDEDIKLLQEEFADRGQEVPRQALSWKKNYFFPLAPTPLDQCLSLEEWSKQPGLPLAALAHSLVFMGVKERAYNLRASALYDPADLAFLKKVPAGSLAAKGLTKAAWVKLTGVSLGRLDKSLGSDNKGDWLAWDLALTAKENLK